MLGGDLPRIFQYVGGIIKRMDGIPYAVGGVQNHIHILASLPKSIALTDFVRVIKSNSSKWIKQLDTHYTEFAWQDMYLPTDNYLSPFQGYFLNGTFVGG